MQPPLPPPTVPHRSRRPHPRCGCVPIPNASLSGNRVENLEREALRALRLAGAGRPAEVELPAVRVLARGPSIDGLAQVPEPVVGLAEVVHFRADSKVGLAGAVGLEGAKRNQQTSKDSGTTGAAGKLTADPSSTALRPSAPSGCR